MACKLLVVLFGCCVCFWWPGIMTPDSQGQYAMAVSGQYSDANPFFMSFLWRYLDKLYQGPALMLVFHLALFFGALYCLMCCLPKRMRLFVLLIPFIPSVGGYSGMIWKDVGFAFSFMLAGSYLGLLTVQQRLLTKKEALCLLCVLLYGVMVKYQAQFVVPWMLLWMAYTYAGQWSRHCLGAFTGFTVLLYGGVWAIDVLGPPVTQNHYWQRVKLYDLAALSIHTNTSLIPEGNRGPAFSVEAVTQHFNQRAVDSLVHKHLIQHGATQKDRDTLWHTWARECVSHPAAYLAHRTNILWGTLTAHFLPENVVPLWMSPSATLYQPMLSIAHIVSFSCMPVWSFVCAVFFLLFALFSSGPGAVAVFFLNATGLTMVGVLFFCSMAGTPRYTYVMTCLWAASLPFAYLCYLDRRKHVKVKQPIDMWPFPV